MGEDCAGLSQKSLAGQLGLKEQQIQRYEASEYASASLGADSECGGGARGAMLRHGIWGDKRDPDNEGDVLG